MSMLELFIVFTKSALSQYGTHIAECAIVLDILGMRVSFISAIL